MTISPHALSTAVSIALIALLYYRRFRRSFGRQPVRPKRMIARAALLGVVGAIMLLATSAQPLTLAGYLGGVAAGVLLGAWGLKLTRFERRADGLHYIPHSWFGIAISVLLLARLAYRFVVLWPTMQAAQQQQANPFAAYQHSPLTLSLFGLLVGYYVFYYLGILQRAKRQPAEASPPLPSQETK
ncbi:MAG: DUF1453 family protein [Proteobacteria bacterium]|nr:DUF1453 family protein [Pseudomonadota bacterium]